jgi:hypothetical protein
MFALCDGRSDPGVGSLLALCLSLGSHLSTFFLPSLRCTILPSSHVCFNYFGRWGGLLHHRTVCASIGVWMHCFAVTCAPFSFLNRSLYVAYAKNMPTLWCTDCVNKNKNWECSYIFWRFSSSSTIQLHLVNIMAQSSWAPVLVIQTISGPVLTVQSSSGPVLFQSGPGSFLAVQFSSAPVLMVQTISGPVLIVRSSSGRVLFFQSGSGSFLAVQSSSAPVLTDHLSNINLSVILSHPSGPWRGILCQNSIGIICLFHLRHMVNRTLILRYRPNNMCPVFRFFV